VPALAMQQMTFVTKKIDKNHDAKLQPSIYLYPLLFSLAVQNRGEIIFNFNKTIYSP
jgi:hypothetical protein